MEVILFKYSYSLKTHTCIFEGMLLYFPADVFVIAIFTLHIMPFFACIPAFVAEVH